MQNVMSDGNEFKLLIATKNAGKAAELRSLLAAIPEVRVHSLAEFPQIESVDETDSSYVENATRKASTYSQQMGMWSIADDSGLEVDALDGSPGVLSARYGGARLSDAERVQLLLRNLAGFQPGKRGARFRCVVAIATHDGQILHVQQGVCEGTIAMEPRGSNGFGYDPIFIPEADTRTFGEIPQADKDRISHRGKALRGTMDFLKQYLSKLDRPDYGS